LRGYDHSLCFLLAFLPVKSQVLSLFIRPVSPIQKLFFVRSTAAEVLPMGKR